MTEHCELEPTPEELKAWKEYDSQHPDLADIGIPIPYPGIPVGGAVVNGIFYLKNPVENSYTDGVVVGIVNGVYHLDRNRSDITLYDPTGSAARVEIKVDFSGKLEARFCTRNWRLKWSCTGWIRLASW
jgi:hypothetical protein